MKNIALKLGLLTLFLGAANASQRVLACDGGDEDVTSAQIKGWTVSSSEVPGEEDRTSLRWPHFKLPHLMDGDAKTPWVFRGQGQKAAFEPSWGARFALNFERETPVLVDEIRIMNGYHKRPDLFWRNDRVVQIGIALNGKKLKTANLSDKMGWHSISIPRSNVSTLLLEFIGVRKGKGADNDVCLSEIAFFNHGRQIKS